MIDAKTKEEIVWHTINDLPKKGFGWFGVAVLPGNHSGSGHDSLCDLEGDNQWRSRFGYTKAWHNNGRWFEPNPHGNRSEEITSRVTHWSELPSVPLLTESHFAKPGIFEKYIEPIQEYAKQQAIKFAEFLHPTEDHNWQMYDGHDRWINLRNNEVKTTEQLFQLFEKENINKHGDTQNEGVGMQ